MKERIGEKIGWTAGWIGGFIWVFILSIVFLSHERIVQGLSGIALNVIAIISIVFFAPWRFPLTPYWKLILPPYGMFFLSIVWAIWSYGGIGAAGLRWWDIFWLLPIFLPFLMMPFGNLAKKKWADSITQQSTPKDAAEPRH